MRVAEAGGLERAAKFAVEPSDGREVMDAGNADPRELRKKARMSRSGSTPLTPAMTGVAFTCGSTSRSAVRNTSSLASRIGSIPASDP